MTLLDKITLTTAVLTAVLVAFDYIWRSFSFSIRKAGIGVAVAVLVICCVAWWIGGG